MWFIAIHQKIYLLITLRKKVEIFDSFNTSHSMKKNCKDIDPNFKFKKYTELINWIIQWSWQSKLKLSKTLVRVHNFFRKYLKLESSCWLIIGLGQSLQYKRKKESRKVAPKFLAVQTECNCVLCILFRDESFFRRQKKFFDCEK